MLRSPLQAYDQGSKATTSNRGLEANALFKTARLLEDCQKSWDAPETRLRLREALKRNQRLWTLFQAELARPDHELPVDLRRDLLRISAFIDKRTFELLSAPEPEKLTALIDINRQIASGLSTEPAPEPQEAAR